jgi:MFS family permease
VGLSVDRPLTAGEIVLVFLPLFVVALGYGAVLPILPSVLERVHASGVAAGGAMHAGLFSAIYIGAFVIAAPVWGKVTDAQGPRAVLMIGLLGYAAATVWFGFADSLAVAYTTRFVAGVFAAGLLPATSALIVARCRGEVRSRHLAWVNTASIAGFLVGPALTGWLHDFIAADRVTWSNPLHATAVPIWTTGTIALASALGIALGVGRSRNPTDNTGAMDMPLMQPDRHAKQRILLFSALGAFGVGAFEVGLSLQSQQSWRWSASALAWLFAICSLVMLVIQLALFARLRRRVGLSGLVVSGFAAMAAGFTLLAGTSTYGLVALLVTVIALGSGVLLPTLSLAMADQAGGATVGAAIGYQNAAANLGQAAGSAAVGFLFNVLPVASFAIVAALMLAATVAAWRIARVPGRLLGVATLEPPLGQSHKAGAHE